MKQRTLCYEVFFSSLRASYHVDDALRFLLLLFFIVVTEPCHISITETKK